MLACIDNNQHIYWWSYIACSDWKWQLWCNWHYWSQRTCFFAQILASWSWKTINTHWIVWWMRQVCREFRWSHRHCQCFTRSKSPYCHVHDCFCTGKLLHLCLVSWQLMIWLGIQSRRSDTIYAHECQQSCHGVCSQLFTMSIWFIDDRVPKLKVRTSLCQNIDHRHADWQEVMRLWWWSSLGQKEEFEWLVLRLLYI